MSDNKAVCDHPVGFIPNESVNARDWNEKLLAFIAVVDDFNVRGQRDQINHPDFVREFKFCPHCGASINREGLMTFGDAFKVYDAAKEAKNP